MAKKKTKEAKTVFTFWKENRIDQEYQLTLDQIKEKYLEYLNKKDPKWILYYGHRSVPAFVGEVEGLNSVADQPDIFALEILLTDVRLSLPCYDEKKKEILNNTDFEDEIAAS